MRSCAASHRGTGAAGGAGRAGDARAFNLDQRGAGELDPQTLHTLVNTPPLMAATRAVVVRGVEQLKKGAKLRQELLRYLGAPNPTTLLLLVQGAGEKADPELVRLTTAVQADPLSPADAARWLTARATAVGLSLPADAAD